MCALLMGSSTGLAAGRAGRLAAVMPGAAPRSVAPASWHRPLGGSRLPLATAARHLQAGWRGRLQAAAAGSAAGGGGRRSTRRPNSGLIEPQPWEFSVRADGDLQGNSSSIGRFFPDEVGEAKALREAAGRMQTCRVSAALWAQPVEGGELQEFQVRVSYYTPQNCRIGNVQQLLMALGIGARDRVCFARLPHGGVLASVGSRAAGVALPPSRPFRQQQQRALAGQAALAEPCSLTVRASGQLQGSCSSVSRFFDSELKTSQAAREAAWASGVERQPCTVPATLLAQTAASGSQLQEFRVTISYQGHDVCSIGSAKALLKALLCLLPGDTVCLSSTPDGGVLATAGSRSGVASPPPPLPLSQGPDADKGYLGIVPPLLPGLSAELSERLLGGLSVHVPYRASARLFGSPALQVAFPEAVEAVRASGASTDVDLVARSPRHGGAQRTYTLTLCCNTPQQPYFYLSRAGELVVDLELRDGDKVHLWRQPGKQVALRRAPQLGGPLAASARGGGDSSGAVRLVQPPAVPASPTLPTFPGGPGAAFGMATGAASSPGGSHDGAAAQGSAASSRNSPRRVRSPSPHVRTPQPLPSATMLPWPPPPPSPHPRSLRDLHGSATSAPSVLPPGAAAGATARASDSPDATAAQGFATATPPVLSSDAVAPVPAACEPKLTPAERVVLFWDLKKGLAVVPEGPHAPEELWDLGVGHVIAFGSSPEEGEWAEVWWLQGMHNVTRTCCVGRLPGTDAPRREYWLLLADNCGDEH
ncbi:hypothetical protein HYH03_001696 [Edaphochlamys debaryana]|uniref:Uncharacterized protein n=1 Tax=Edaphochlamys debaryana TaxID=47281 RepID=A0A835YE75_9CHLO|nr:hypothetical protein HYH03_001696 [Edaphochlamys debaryana]|eukprot:KAG2500114.1 hypothetical protein HYH03_001696 [Edaphochlamys debaryana]